MATTPQTSQAQLAAENIAVRNLVLSSSIEKIQISNQATGNFVPSATPVITLKPIMAGLTKGFWLSITASIVNLGTNTLYLTEQGIANIFSNVIVNDPNGDQRITTDGFGIVLNNFERFKTSLGSIKSATETTSYFGNTLTNVSIPASIATNTVAAPAEAKFFMWIPLAYSSQDLRGAIYTNIANAAMNISLTVNPNAISTATATSAPVTSGVQPMTAYANASAVGSTGAYISNIEITTRQVYLDNLPAYTQAFAPEFNQGGLLLPVGDLSIQYQLIKVQPNLSLSANNKSLIAYAPQRSYLSTNLVYNNGNTLNAGTDVSKITIESANTNIFLDTDPSFLGLLIENEFELDLPAATYYLNRRHSPINTLNYGNTNIGFTPSVVNAGAVIVEYDEVFSYTGITSSAQAIGA